MSLKFYRLDVNIQIDSCRIQRNSNADATVLLAKPKEKEPALSVCKLFSLCRSGCSALGFSFSRSGPDSAVPAPQTVHRPQAQSRETPSFPSRFSRCEQEADRGCLLHTASAGTSRVDDPILPSVSHHDPGPEDADPAVPSERWSARW